MNKNKGILVILSGPSGVGKGTVIKKILETNSNIRLSVSATTREKRAGEKDGETYFFYSKSKFLNLASSGKMLEYAEYCKNFYGTPKEPIDYWLCDGKDVLLEIEVAGARQVQNVIKNCVKIFLLPPSMKTLYNRLKERGTEPAEVINKRILRAKEEICCCNSYDYLVINNNVSECVANVLAIIKAEKLKFSRMENHLEEVLG